MKLDQRIHDRATALVDKGNDVLLTDTPSSGIGFPTLDDQAYSNWRSQSLAFLRDLLGHDNTYTTEFDRYTAEGGYVGNTEAGIGILRAVVEDIEQGHIETVRQLITAEVFTDMFEQAEYLLESGYKAPAASLAGAVLENGLRTIANRNQIQVRSRDDLSSLSQRLASKGIYNRLIQKRVAVWTDVRNAADHGQFDEFDGNDVKDLIQGAQTLLADHM